MNIATALVVEDLASENDRLRHELKKSVAEILYLKEQLEWCKRQIFGKKSERVVDTHPEQLQLDGFESVEQKPAETQTIPSHERQKRTSTGKDTIQLPPDLPVETTVIDVSEEDKICKETGVALQKIGEEISHKLAYRPGSYLLKRIVRPKYAYPQQEEKGTAPMPNSILPKCRADESLLADMITRKFYVGSCRRSWSGSPLPLLPLL